jgi:rhamnogalacturonyl hydrolase YesR
VALGLAIATGAAAAGAQPPAGAGGDTRMPLQVARVLAMRYPETASMSYVPALSWSGTLRLSRLTGDAGLREKVRRELAPFLTGEKPAIAEPYRVSSLSAHLATADLATIEKDHAAAALARKAADIILPQAEADLIRFGAGWTEDMFMASALLSRVGAHSGDERYARVLGRMLVAYAGKLQRPDGLFVHAVDSPYAWGRGNGFALLGLTEALTHLPESWPDRARVLEIYRRHIHALMKHQSNEGAWRQIVDEPASYQELTVTAMTVAAIARGVRSGWLDRDLLPVIDRGWRAVLARVNDDGTVRDACESTGAGPTKEYYLNRRPITGADDRGGAMALLAALEMAELKQ